jgi:hypothetical protein
MLYVCLYKGWAFTALAPRPTVIFGAIGGMKIGRGNRSTRRKPTPAPL